MNENTKNAANGYEYFVTPANDEIYILKHNVIVAVVNKQTLSSEGVEQFAEGFGLLYDEMLYSNSSYGSGSK